MLARAVEHPTETYPTFVFAFHYAANLQEDAKAEANDLLLRVESKASKEHVKACLDKKANKGELEDLRVRLDR